jgi:membrane associated rhomboid family serine protease
MTEHFLVSWAALLEGRYWTLLTSSFSHYHLLHLLLNMYVLKEFGDYLELNMGSQKFLILYLFAGLVSSFSHCFFSRYFLLKPDLSALGASGAISGLLAAIAYLNPKKKVYFIGLFPVSLVYGVSLLVLIDLRGIWGQYQGEMSFIGHGAHLGGCIGGLIFAFVMKRKLTLLDG